jgi:uncharacterized protein YnzC (UPF0291/DUF896 family)
MSVVLDEIIVKIGSLSEEDQEKLIMAVDEQKRLKIERRAFIRSLKGKYKDGLSSVDEFIARKQRDIEMEDLGWQPR